MARRDWEDSMDDFGGGFDGKSRKRRKTKEGEGGVSKGSGSSVDTDNFNREKDKKERPLVSGEDRRNSEVLASFDMVADLCKVANINKKGEKEIYPKEERLESLKRLILSGVNVEEFGVGIRRDGGEVFYVENGLANIDEELVKEMVKKVEVVSESGELEEVNVQKNNQAENGDGNQSQPDVQVENIVKYPEVLEKSDGAKAEDIKQNIDIYKLLYQIGYYPETEEAKLARKKLDEMGVSYKKIIDEADRQLKTKIANAVYVVETKKLVNGIRSLEEAKQIINDYLGVVSEVSAMVETENKDEALLEYLKSGKLLEDLEMAYSGRKEAGGARDRLLACGLKPILLKNTDKLHFKAGQQFTIRLKDYLAGKEFSGKERGWFLSDLRRVGIDKEVLDKVRTKEVGKEENTLERQKRVMEEMTRLADPNLNKEELLQFYRAIRVIVTEIEEPDLNIEQAKEFFMMHIDTKLKQPDTAEKVVDDKQDKMMTLSEDTKDEEKFVLTSEEVTYLYRWLMLSSGVNLPSDKTEDELLNILKQRGFVGEKEDKLKLKEAVNEFRKDSDSLETKTYLESLFSGQVEKGSHIVKENNETLTESEKWMKVSSLISRLKITKGTEREGLYAEVESMGIRIRGAIIDLIEAGASKKVVEGVFDHILSLVELKKIGKEKSLKDYPVAVDKYTNLAYLLRVEWYN